MVEFTGVVASELAQQNPSATTVLISTIGGIVITVITVVGWRWTKGRTDSAPSPKDLVDVHSRNTVLEQNVADLNRRLTVAEAWIGVADDEIDKMRDWIWPPRT